MGFSIRSELASYARLKRRCYFLFVISYGGLLAGLNMANRIHGRECVILPPSCMMGAMAHYITHTHPKYFQPMNATYGIMQCLSKTNKHNKKEVLAKQALDIIKEKKACFDE